MAVSFKKHNILLLLFCFLFFPTKILENIFNAGQTLHIRNGTEWTDRQKERTKRFPTHIVLIGQHSHYQNHQEADRLGKYHALSEPHHPTVCNSAVWPQANECLSISCQQRPPCSLVLNMYLCSTSCLCFAGTNVW